MKLSNRELGTVLAALRLWQIHTSWGDDGHEARCPDIHEWEVLDHIEGEGLSRAEIDELCERLNRD